MVSKNPEFFLKARHLNMKKYDGIKTTVTTLVERDLITNGGFRNDLLYRIVHANKAIKILSRGQDEEGNLHCLTSEQVDTQGLRPGQALAVFDPAELRQVKPGEYTFRNSSRKLSAVRAVYLPRYFRQE